MNSTRSGGTDPLLLAEIVMVLVLFGLAVALYLVPAADNVFAPGWWTPALLVGLALATLLLDGYRRRRRRHEELHRGIRQDARQTEDEQPSSP